MLARTRPLLIALILGVAALAACGPTPGTTAPLPAPAPDPTPAPTPDPTPAPDLAPRPTPVPDPAAPAECDPGTRDAIGATVSQQLDAFGAEDFVRAYEATSPYFRRLRDAEAFERMIREGYPELVGNDGHRLADCLVLGRSAYLVVGVRSGVRETVLRYDLSEEPEGWRIDGAMRLEGVSLPPDRTV